MHWSGLEPPTPSLLERIANGDAPSLTPVAYGSTIPPSAQVAGGAQESQAEPHEAERSRPASARRSAPHSSLVEAPLIAIERSAEWSTCVASLEEGTQVLEPFSLPGAQRANTGAGATAPSAASHGVASQDAPPPREHQATLSSRPSRRQPAVPAVGASDPHGQDYRRGCDSQGLWQVLNVASAARVPHSQLSKSLTSSPRVPDPNEGSLPQPGAAKVSPRLILPRRLNVTVQPASGVAVGPPPIYQPGGLTTQLHAIVVANRYRVGDASPRGEASPRGVRSRPAYALEVTPPQAKETKDPTLSITDHLGVHTLQPSYERTAFAKQGCYSDRLHARYSRWLWPCSVAMDCLGTMRHGSRITHTHAHAHTHTHQELVSITRHRPQTTCDTPRTTHHTPHTTHTSHSIRWPVRTAGTSHTTWHAPHCPKPHHTTPRHATLRHTIPHDTTRHHTTPHHTTPHHTKPYHTTPRHTKPYHTTPHH